MKKIILACLLSMSVWAADSNVYTVTFNSPIDTVEKNMLAQFKASKLMVVWQLDILGEFKKKGLDKKFGKKFNTNELANVRTMVACNGKLGNAVMNADSTMMAYCPVRLTLTEKDGKTSVLFVRPSSAPKDSKAYPVLVKLEKKVIGAIVASMEFEN